MIADAICKAIDATAEKAKGDEGKAGLDAATAALQRIVEFIPDIPADQLPDPDLRERDCWERDLMLAANLLHIVKGTARMGLLAATVATPKRGYEFL